MVIYGEGKRKVEIFGAGCPACDLFVETIKRIACPSCEVEVLNMHRPGVAARAAQYGVRGVPAVVIDGRIADCCTGREVDESSLRAAGVGTPLS